MSREKYVVINNKDPFIYIIKHIIPMFVTNKSNIKHNIILISYCLKLHIKHNSYKIPGRALCPFFKLSQYLASPGQLPRM